jgi:hypothetical protein
MSDEKITLTPEEAESILVEGENVHNYANPAPGMFVGCDYERADAIKAIRAALQLEIGGDHCKRMKHALVVWTSETRVLFFQTDPAKIEAIEARKAVPAC